MPPKTVTQTKVTTQTGVIIAVIALTALGLAAYGYGFGFGFKPKGLGYRLSPPTPVSPLQQTATPQYKGGTPSTVKLCGDLQEAPILPQGCCSGLVDVSGVCKKPGCGWFQTKKSEYKDGCCSQLAADVNGICKLPGCAAFGSTAEYYTNSCCGAALPDANGICKLQGCAQPFSNPINYQDSCCSGLVEQNNVCKYASCSPAGASASASVTGQCCSGLVEGFGGACKYPGCGDGTITTATSTQFEQGCCYGAANASGTCAVKPPEPQQPECSSKGSPESASLTQQCCMGLAPGANGICY